MNKKLKLTLITVPLLAVLSFGGYYTFDIKASPNSETQTVLIGKDFPSTSDLEEMAAEADLVVIGSYSSFDSKWNMARNPEDPSKEDTENYVEGHLYNFNIDEVIKGIESNEVIKVNHRYLEELTLVDSNEEINSDGTIKKEATKVTTKKVKHNDPLYIEPKLNQNYMLFLKKNSAMNNYFGAIEPFIVKINSQGYAELQSNLLDLDLHDASVEQTVGSKNFVLKNDIENVITDRITGKSLEELKTLVKKFN
jgi:hypothetical protein